MSQFCFNWILLCFYLWLWANIELTITKNTCKSPAVLMAMQMHPWDAGRIASSNGEHPQASLKPTGCRHRASACAA